MALLAAPISATCDCCCYMIMNSADSSCLKMTPLAADAKCHKMIRVSAETITS